MASTTPRRIVVGLDGSPSSLAALRWALREAVSVHAPVEVVHCRESHLAELLFGPSPELHRGSVCMVHNEVSAALAELPVKPTVRQTSTHGRPARELCRIAADAQMLVLGAHGHTTATDLLLGEVAPSCLRHARCRVVVVDGHESVIRRTAPDRPQSTLAA